MKTILHLVLIVGGALLIIVGLAGIFLPVLPGVILIILGLVVLGKKEVISRALTKLPPPLNKIIKF